MIKKFWLEQAAALLKEFRLFNCEFSSIQMFNARNDAKADKKLRIIPKS